MWKHKATIVFGLGLTFAIVLCIQLTLYLVNIFFGIDIFYNIFQFCIRMFQRNTIEYYIALFLVNSYVVYTIILISKKVTQQITNTSRFKEKIKFLTNEDVTVEMNKRFNRKGEDILVIDSNKPVALTFGLRNPRIVISTLLIDMLDSSELEAVILHESAHQVHYDTIKVFILQVISEVMWYIPLTKWAFKNFKILIELAADEYAITRMGNEVGLCSALLKLIKTQLNINAAPLLVPFTNEAVDYRLKQLVEPHHSLPFKLKTQSVVISVYLSFFTMILMVIV